MDSCEKKARVILYCLQQQGGTGVMELDLDVTLGKARPTRKRATEEKEGRLEGGEDQRSLMRNKRVMKVGSLPS